MILAKYLISLTGLLFGLTGAAALGATSGLHAIDKDMLVKVPITTLYAPAHWEDEDRAVIGFEGWLPAQCYELRDAEVRYDLPSRKVFIIQWARPGYCAEDARPFRFHNTVELTPLEIGHWEVDAFGHATIGMVEVVNEVQRTCSVDPSLPTPYCGLAQATGAQLVSPSTAKMVAEVNFALLNSCLWLERIDVERQGQVIEIRPLIHATSGPDCQAIENIFQAPVDLPTLEDGRYMLHIRNPDGSSYNHFFMVWE